MDERGGPKMIALTHFLVVFDRATSQLISLRAFENEGGALTEFSLAERSNVGNEEIEVVLLSADSMETLKHTHGHYFSGKDQRMDYPKLLGA
jgi:hypothetical protein